MAGSSMWYLRTVLAVMLILVSALAWQQAEAFTLNVIGCDANNNCNLAVNGFRWQIEEDNTFQPNPGNRFPFGTGLNIHNSHAPVVLNGHSGTGSATVAASAEKGYYVSVLPDSGFAMGGITVPAGAASATVKVHQYPVPTAQISILVFEDHNPINNVFDPGEFGLEGWNIRIFDQLGSMTQDAFGNPIGTIYDPADPTGGTVISFGNGTITTCTAAEVAQPNGGPRRCTQTGEAVIKFIPPGKYGIRATPAAGENPLLWSQTATIEGTPGVDAWVKNNEPKLFIEGFGTGFYHAFIGFVYLGSDTNTVAITPHHPLPWIQTPPLAGATVSGTNRFNHFGPPPDNQQFVVGAPVPECMIGLNDLTSNIGVYALPCDAASSFSIPNVPAGNYQIVTWDKPLDALFGFNAVTSDGATAVNLGNVLSFRWFGTLKGSIFQDANENGFPDAGDAGLHSFAVNLRFRDGSMYQTTLSDLTGEYTFAEVFPFFKWLITEVDFGRMKPTGLTYVVDAGGTTAALFQQDPRVLPADNGWIMPSGNDMNPQAQVCVAQPDGTAVDNDGNPCTVGAPLINVNTGNNLSVTQTGPVLLKSQMLFLNQTNYMHWGKKDYNLATGENGGITGVVGYQTTRAEEDPRLAVIDGWEPGIPRVQVVLYKDANADGVIDDLNGNGQVDLADVDNWPFGWKDGGPMGPEDIKRNGPAAGANNPALIFSAGDAYQVTVSDSFSDNKPTGCVQNLPPIAGVQPCFDNYSTWNQIRDGVFDGGYGFGLTVDGNPNFPTGTYIVEGVPPPGYQVQKEEDRNVVFGDQYKPSTQVVLAPCVGSPANGMPPHIVPSELTLFPGEPIFANPAFNVKIGQQSHLCNMKQVTLLAGQNAAADFHMFTEVPKAARVVGFANNDLSAEFRAASPIFGEKSSPSWLPISFQDWQGNEVAHIYMDEFGAYEALLPSTFTVNPPIPTGVSPNMLTAVLNYPLCSQIHAANCKADGTDKFYNPTFGVTPWTLDYWPGKTTYLDTPMVPLAAFAGFTQNGPDVEFESGIPVINSVNGPSSYGGPLVCNTTAGSNTITITSAGATEVLNPDFDPAIAGSVQYLTRDYGFGTVPGTVTVAGATANVTVNSWSSSSISATITGGVGGQLMVTRGDNGKSSLYGITLHVRNDDCAAGVKSAPGLGGTIQEVIDAAVDGDLIIVKANTTGIPVYKENLFLYRKVKLQGSGAGSTAIFATPLPADRLANWHTKAATLLGLATDPFVANEAPGILVLSGATGAPAGVVGVAGVPDASDPELIDGFRIFGAIGGGAIHVYQGVGDSVGGTGIAISNNKITNNQGTEGGGITFGIPNATGVNLNPNVTVQYNMLTRNGGVQGGGAVVLYEDSESYKIQNNWIAGNFSRFYGAGISHVGLSSGDLTKSGLIKSNKLLFNEIAFGGAAFNDGAAIFIGGANVAGVALTEGSGNVVIDGNIIQGNLATAGSGAGIMLLRTNGLDVQGAPAVPASWYGITITNNMIVNNVAGMAGGGIAMQDAAKVSIVNNTIANNNSAATAANAFAAGTNISTPQGAGIVSNAHSTALTGIVGFAQIFSNPLLENNIIRGNRAYFFDGTVAIDPLDPTVQLKPAVPDGGVWDLQVNVPADPTLKMSPENCILTFVQPAAPGNGNGSYVGNGNSEVNPIFVKPYVNTLYARATIDEGGNATTLRFTPLKKEAGEYHIKFNSLAVNAGKVPSIAVATDIDGEARPNAGSYDIGADEMYQATVPGVRSGLAVYSNALWYIDKVTDGTWQSGADATAFFGFPGATPVSGNWTGLGDTKIGVYANGLWYLDMNGNGAWDGEPTDKLCNFGFPGAVPVTGDWNGTGITNIGVYANGVWYLDVNGNCAWDGTPTDAQYTFGFAGAVPVTGDWTKTGKTNIGVYANANWYLDINGNGVWNDGVDAQYNFGFAGVAPVTGDWNASGSTKIGVYTNGTWYLDINGNGAWNGTPTDSQPFYGFPGAVPVSGNW